VIAGWDEALQMMSKGGKAKLVIPSKIAYGARGAGGVIPPFAPLLFDVELVDIQKASAPSAQSMPEQQIEMK
jgi:FKBP-type peptidyl-prolyl cis-trans isomerase